MTTQSINYLALAGPSGSAISLAAASIYFGGKSLNVNVLGVSAVVGLAVYNAGSIISYMPFITQSVHEALGGEEQDILLGLIGAGAYEIAVSGGYGSIGLNQASLIRALIGAAAVIIGKRVGVYAAMGLGGDPYRGKK